MAVLVTCWMVISIAMCHVGAQNTMTAVQVVGDTNVVNDLCEGALVIIQTPNGTNCSDVFRDVFTYDITARGCRQVSLYDGCNTTSGVNVYTSYIDCLNECKPAVVAGCPPQDACVGIASQECKSDTDCLKFNTKCCQDEKCALTCMDVTTMTKPGVCPFTSPGQCDATSPIFECQGDAYCNDTQKCCNAGCGTRCQDPVQSKPGFCPNNFYWWGATLPALSLFRMPCYNASATDGCHGDYDCPDNQKCCSYGCSGFGCARPITVNPWDCDSPANQTDQSCAPSTAPITMFTYIAESATCVEFNQTECNLKSANVFATLEECTNNCSMHRFYYYRARADATTVAPDVCKATPVGDNNNCTALVAKFTYNASSSVCHKFMYGGCGAMGNLFDDVAQCRDRCGGANTKPGTCPTLASPTCEATKSCTEDWDCEFDLKCCPSACGGATCSEPLGKGASDVTTTTTTTRSPLPRSGPVRPNCRSSMLVCKNSKSCTSDAGCRANLKCCNQRCCTRCFSPGCSRAFRYPLS